MNENETLIARGIFRFEKNSKR